MLDLSRHRTGWRGWWCYGGSAPSGRPSAFGRWRLALGACVLLAGCGSAGTDADPWGDSVITGAGGSSGAGSPGVVPSGSGGASASSGHGPPYPVVLAHGFFGFERFAGLDFATYFYRVQQTLAAEGETVWTPSVDPFNDSTYRGAQLLEEIRVILATTGAEKVNIIAHSQGGLDARVVAHDHPELVASVVTISAPHGGSKVADVALQLVADSRLRDLLDDLIETIGEPLYDEVGNETSVTLSLKQFSGPGIAEFNDRYIDAPGVFYASFAGRTDHASSGRDCLTLEGAPFVKPFEGDLDPVNPLLSLTETILDGGFGDPIPNDGLVRAKDARWGHFWGCIPADHFDEVGQIFGENPGSGNHWRYMDFYRAVVARLRQEGY
jgi:triacylglycerol lipase